jgi:hypothetical protein
MDRRCTSEVCQVTATGRTASLDLSMSQVLLDPTNDWQKMTAGRTRVARDIPVDWKQYNQDQFIFSHCTIVASVNTAENGYYIDPACSPLVNNNGNAWTNPVLLATFRSFVGGENYLEHVQIPELSKGKILDAVIRPIKYNNSKIGKDAPVYYTDILVATDRKHDKLCSRIASGELGTMSMGCLAHYVQCSRCGSVLGDNDPNCEHIDGQLLKSFTDENGIKRMTAELCGRSYKDTNGNWVGDPKSLKFIEASWVDRPAFEGAVLNHFLSDIPKAAAKILEYPTHKLEQTMEELFRTRVADSRGMMVLRVAMLEMNRRRREDMASRVAKTFWV